MINSFIEASFWSLFPISELRGGIPLAVYRGFSIYSAFIICVMANIRTTELNEYTCIVEGEYQYTNEDESDPNDDPATYIIDEYHCEFNALLLFADSYGSSPPPFYFSWIADAS